MLAHDLDMVLLEVCRVNYFNKTHDLFGSAYILNCFKCGTIFKLLECDVVGIANINPAEWADNIERTHSCSCPGNVEENRGLMLL